MREDFLYFAFGSNLHTPQMAERCPGSEPLHSAHLDGHRLAFCGHSPRWGGGVATVVDDSAATVPGLVYRMTADDIEKLDVFENYPEIYRREDIALKTQDGSSLAAFTYRRNIVEPSAPSLKYFHQIWSAYRSLGLEQRGLWEAVETSLGNGKPGPGGSEQDLIPTTSPR